MRLKHDQVDQRTSGHPALSCK